MSAVPNIEFHNLFPEPMTAGEGMLLPRFPEAVRHSLESPGHLKSQESTGGEIRFVTAAPQFRIFLSALEQDTEVAVFNGDFQHAICPLKQGLTQCLQLVAPERLPQMRREAPAGRRFHPDVWRVVLNRGAVAFVRLETCGYGIRPPAAAEKPRLCWLAYGSSITHSSMNGYPHQAAQRLGVDLLNKGLGGSCFIESTTADFLADGCEWDFATFELGINMRGRFTPEAFDQCARYLVRRCVEARPHKPIFLLTVFPNFASAAHAASPDAATEREEAFNASLRQIASDFRARNVHLIEGASILTDFTFLRSDLLHPGECGNCRMGENLAHALSPIVTQLFTDQ